MSLKKKFNKQTFDRCGIMGNLVIARRHRLAQFQAVQRALASNWCTVGALRRQLACQHREDRVMAQRVMIHNVIVTQR